MPECQRKTKKQFELDAKAKHSGHLYEYDNFNYVNDSTDGWIFCKSCDVHFLQSPNTHLQGSGCMLCGIKKVHDIQSERAKKRFFVRSAELHGDSYDYSEVVYKTAKTKVKIYCNTCRCYFWQSPNNHTSGNGCSTCNKNNKTEARIFKELQNNFQSLTILRNFKPPFLGKQEYDIYIPDLNIAIEYDGEQHSNEGHFFYNDRIKYLDRRKNVLSKRNGIKLYRISYKDINFRTPTNKLNENLIPVYASIRDAISSSDI